MTQLPLSERVDAPLELQPTPVPGVTWRPATPDDIDAVTALVGAMAAVDHPDWAETRDDIELEFGHSWVELEHDGLAGVIDGELVAFGFVVAPPHPETVVPSILEGGVHPASRGRGIVSGHAVTMGWNAPCWTSTARVRPARWVCTPAWASVR